MCPSQIMERFPYQRACFEFLEGFGKGRCILPVLCEYARFSEV